MPERHYETGRVIAGLLDERLEDGSPHWRRDWLSQHYPSVERIRSVTMPAVGLLQQQIGAILAMWMAEHPDDAWTDPHEPPMWSVIEGPDGSRTPTIASGHVGFGPGSVADVALLVSMHTQRDRPFVTFDVAEHYAEEALAFGHRLFDEARAFTAPWKGRMIEFGIPGPGEEAEATILAPPNAKRDDLILPDRVWRELDTNVHGLLAMRDTFERLGLGLNRGVLLHGPPGTGKTALTRVLASELAGTVTTFFPSPVVLARSLTHVYRMASYLAPSLVVLEDVDLIVSHRKGGQPSGSLVEFLTSVDGFMTDHNGVVTLATTNAPELIDEAARRAARFDRIIEIPRPGPGGRERIWQRYLRDLDVEVDLDRLVRATEGGSGADVREIVRHALLETAGHPTTSAFVRSAKARGLPTGGSRRGQYL